jgi:hypothetical protein
MISGIIKNWGVDFLSTEHKKCICGEIFDSTQFSNGKMIYTSDIKDISLFNTYFDGGLNIEPNIIVETINKSKYILNNVSGDFKDYITTLITKDKLDEFNYNFNTTNGTVKCIKWYFNKIV